MTLHESHGILHYGDRKLIVSVDPQLALFYRSLIPKYKNVAGQRYAPHISVVRNEVPPNMNLWGKYEGERILFLYDPIIQNDTLYYWLNVFSVRLEVIRVELGLPVTSPYTKPPDGFLKCFHTTLGNCKSL